MKLKLKILLIMILLFISPFILAGGSTERINVKGMLAAKDAKEYLENSLLYMVPEVDTSDEIKYSLNVYQKIYELENSLDYQFFKDKIPEEYLTTFLLYTRNNKNLRLLVYSMMKHETQNFTAYINTNNGNRSVDHGPMMLNSNNLKNSWFMELYGVNEEELKKLGFDIKYNEIDKYNYYMIIGINLIVSHLQRYHIEGTSYRNTIFKALQAYNGGEKVHTPYVSKRTLRMTISYARKILSIYYSTSENYSNFINQNNNIILSMK